MNSLSLIKQDLGMVASSKTLKVQDEYVVIKQLLLKMTDSSRKLLVEAMLGIEQFEKYLNNKELIGYLFYKEKEVERQIVAKKQIQTNILKKFASRMGINVYGRHCLYYFILDSEEKINRFVPLSNPAHLDSYLVYPIENEQTVRQKVLKGSTLAEILPLCYAYMPNQCYGGMPSDIYSGSMTEQEFKSLAEIMLDKPDFKYLTRSQVNESLASLS